VIVVDLLERISPPILMEVDEPLSKALGKLGKDECIVVTKKGEYVGILDDRTIENVSSDPNTTKIGSLFERAPLIDYGSSLLDICKSFFAGPYKALPVKKGEQVAGILKRKDVIEVLLSAGGLYGLVRDYMSSPVVTIDENATVAQARAKMKENGVRRLVVYGDGRLKGIVSIYDLKMKTARPKEHVPFVKEKHSPEDVLVSSLMVPSEEVAVIGPDAPLSEAARKMVDAGVASLVVVDKNEPIGLLSVRDVLESIMSQEKTPIYFSGVGYEEKMVIDEIKGEVENEVEKIRKSVPLEYVALHFKKYGRKYSVHARFKVANGGIIPVRNHGFDLQGTVHGLLLEFRKIALERLKSDPMREKRRKPYRGEL
jgi:CBS domain-containing protein